MEAKCQLSVRTGNYVLLLDIRLQFAPCGSLTNVHSPPIYLQKFGTTLETDDMLKHVCTRLLDTSSSIDQLNIDLMFEQM